MERSVGREIWEDEVRVEQRMGSSGAGRWGIRRRVVGLEAQGEDDARGRGCGKLGFHWEGRAPGIKSCDLLAGDKEN